MQVQFLPRAPQSSELSVSKRRSRTTWGDVVNEATKELSIPSLHCQKTPPRYGSVFCYLSIPIRDKHENVFCLVRVFIFEGSTNFPYSCLYLRWLRSHRTVAVQSGKIFPKERSRGSACPPALQRCRGGPQRVKRRLPELDGVVKLLT